jgi:hypothetical protein
MNERAANSLIVSLTHSLVQIHLIRDEKKANETNDSLFFSKKNKKVTLQSICRVYPQGKKSAHTRILFLEKSFYSTKYPCVSPLETPLSLIC